MNPKNVFAAFVAILIVVNILYCLLNWICLFIHCLVLYIACSTSMQVYYYEHFNYEGFTSEGWSMYVNQNGSYNNNMQ